jgi:hypothetical protein
MFSQLMSGTGNALNLLGASLHWILRNKKAIAILALLASADAVNALTTKRVMLHLDCGSFELKKSDELGSFLSNLKEPIDFKAKFSEDDKEKECLSSSQSNVAICEPPQTYNEDDFLQVTMEDDSICLPFYKLASEGKLNSLLFLNKDSRKEAIPNMIKHITKTVEVPAEGYTRIKMK